MLQNGVIPIIQNTSNFKNAFLLGIFVLQRGLSARASYIWVAGVCTCFEPHFGTKMLSNGMQV